MMQINQIETYIDCSTLPIYNFMMSLNNNDFTYLIRDANQFSERNIDDYIKLNKRKLPKLLRSVEREYQALTFNKKELVKQKELANLIFLEAKHNAIIQTLNIYLQFFEVEVLMILNELGINFSKDKEIPPQLKKAKMKSLGLKNQINIKTIQFKQKYKINDDEVKEEIEKHKKSIEKQLDQQALLLEANLETGYRIDIRKTSVLRWVNLMELNEEKRLANIK